jgi:hypothetical protein
MQEIKKRTITAFMLSQAELGHSFLALSLSKGTIPLWVDAPP